MSDTPELNRYTTYIPPRSFAFDSVALGIGALCSALCSVECARFLEFVDQNRGRSGASTPELSCFFPVYTLGEWSEGIISESVWIGREDGARENLIIWAKAMVEINSFFKELSKEEELVDTISFIEDEEFIRVAPDGDYGWVPNIEKISAMLGENTLDDDKIKSMIIRSMPSS